MEAKFAESILYRSVAVFVESHMTIRAVEEWIILFIMSAEAATTCSFEYSFHVFSSFFAFLAFHVLLKLLLVANELLLLRLDGSILLDCI